ncbi:helix-turn-helix domain-containing protein [Selenihalanaerobacter shriftii]|uniref:Transcriptional regulator, XRE family with cupin sensor n=1 Tax=Selenihalanaerobacter shriftii TaxID=142842 RepID=A0A1T4PJ23_9FIRM|nr:XRE family transcriptional regulator [Selenihalanaerobacter shriftii]SJZ91499.1 transcriptional regulator, XRE family with cupin sensor [Selenihalanaerobacter shriftii]
MDKKKELGRRVREKRKERDLSLAKLADKVGCTSSFLSQVERGMADPSITSLRKIAQALNVPIFYFLLDSNEHSPVVRKNERKVLAFPSNLTFELLSPDLQRDLEVIYASLEPGAYTCEEPLSHPGEECTLVLEGKMEIKIGDESYQLDAGDSVYYYSSIPHKITSTGKKDLVFVSAITPPDF